MFLIILRLAAQVARFDPTHGEANHGGPSGHLQLLPDMRAMHFDRLGTDAEAACDVLRAEALAQELEHLELAVARTG